MIEVEMSKGVGKKRDAQGKEKGGKDAVVNVSTGIPAFDGLLKSLFGGAGVGLALRCKGDLWIDDHHLVEDVGISLGKCLLTLLGDKKGLNRMWLHEGEGATAVVDLSNRPHCEAVVGWKTEGTTVQEGSVLSKEVRQSEKTLRQRRHL